MLLPFAIVGGAVGMAKMKRAKKEKAIKTAMNGCLAERGYGVSQLGQGEEEAARLQTGLTAWRIARRPGSSISAT